MVAFGLKRLQQLSSIPRIGRCSKASSKPSSMSCAFGIHTRSDHGLWFRVILILTIRFFRAIGLGTSSLTCPSCQRFTEVVYTIPHRSNFRVRCV